MSTGSQWKPSRRAQALDWWLTRILRSIGAGGVVYTTLIRPDGAEMIVFGAMATGLDIGKFAVALVRSALAEARQVNELADSDTGELKD